MHDRSLTIDVHSTLPRGNWFVEDICSRRRENVGAGIYSMTWPYAISSYDTWYNLNCSIYQVRKKANWGYDFFSPCKSHKTREFRALDPIYQIFKVTPTQYFPFILTLEAAHEHVRSSFSLCVYGRVLNFTIIIVREKTLLKQLHDDDWSLTHSWHHDTAQPNLRPLVISSANWVRGRHWHILNFSVLQM